MPAKCFTHINWIDIILNDCFWHRSSIKIKFVVQLISLECTKTHKLHGMCAHWFKLSIFPLINVFHSKTTRFNLLAVRYVYFVFFFLVSFLVFHSIRSIPASKWITVNIYAIIMAFYIFISFTFWLLIYIYIFCIVCFFALLQFSHLHVCVCAHVCSRFHSNKYLHFSSPKYLNKPGIYWWLKFSSRCIDHMYLRSFDLKIPFFSFSSHIFRVS